ncbi:MAG: glycosyltransferase [Bacteroidia bacterium]
MKKELLFITSQLPYPPVKGGVSTSWNLIKYLSQHFQTGMITILKWDDPDHEHEFLSKVNLIEYFSFELNIERTPQTVIKSYLKNVPINLVRNYHPQLAEKIHQWVDEYEYVLVDHYEMFQYIPDHVKAKTIMHEHNAEYIMWQRYSEVSNHPLKKLVTALESKRIKKMEEQFCNRADMVLANPNDKEVLSQLVNGSARIEEIVPCGEDFMLDWPDLQWENTEESLLYIGALTWEANADGLIWFINEGWKKLKTVRPAVKLYIVGKDPDERLIELSRQNPDIILTGFVENLEDYYSKCRIFITPLRFGSGVKLKVINAMFRGLPVVTTPIGSEGLPAENGNHLYHTQEIDEFVGFCEELLTNQESWERLRTESRQLMKKHFSWAIQLDRIKNHIRSL